MIARGIAIAVLACALAGCASDLRSFVVAQRNHQGDLALSRGNLTEAKIGYRLALQLEPHDEHARGGLVDVLTKLAYQQYEHSDFEGALAALALAAQYDPQSVRVQQLHDEVAQAKIKRQIVLANFPNSADTGILIARAYLGVPKLNTSTVKSIKRFQFTYDSKNLSDAIKSSYLMQEEVARLTQRLINYRQLVESGTPARVNTDAAPSSSGSLLPLP